MTSSTITTTTAPTKSKNTIHNNNSNSNNNSNDGYDNEEGDNDQVVSSSSSSSPEAAGIARGMGRSVQQSLRVIQRGPIGRLPLKPKYVKRVGKISDHASKGIEWYETFENTKVQETSTSSSSSSSSSKISFQGLGLRVWAFTTGLARNTVLGAVVFDSYESILDMARKQRQQKEKTNYYHLPVVVHCLGGAIGGSLHSILSLSIDTVFINRFSTLPSTSLVMNSTLHHSLAHASLFGGYECMKRLLYKILDKEDYQYQKTYSSQEDSSNGININHVVVTATAGAFAGVLQNTTSHYTGMWLRVETTDLTIYQQILKEKAATKKQQQNPFRILLQLKRNMFLPLPQLRQTMLAMPASAIAFLAYEYASNTDDLVSVD